MQLGMNDACLVLDEQLAAPSFVAFNIISDLYSDSLEIYPYKQIVMTLARHD